MWTDCAAVGLFDARIGRGPCKLMPLLGYSSALLGYFLALLCSCKLLLHGCVRSVRIVMCCPSLTAFVTVHSCMRLSCLAFFTLVKILLSVCEFVSFFCYAHECLPLCFNNDFVFDSH